MNRIKRLMIAAVVVMLAVSVSSIQPARAAIWQLTDDLETSPESRWTFGGTGGSGSFTTYLGELAHSGVTHAQLRSQSGTTRTWYSVARTVRVTPFAAGRTLSCTARIWIRGYRNSCPGSAPFCQGVFRGGHGNFEIIDPATWNYVSLKPFSVSPGSGYIAFTTSDWNPPSQNVMVRVALGSDMDESLTHVVVDDLGISCWYP